MRMPTSAPPATCSTRSRRGSIDGRPTARRGGRSSRCTGATGMPATSSPTTSGCSSAWSGRGMPIVLLAVLALSLCWSLGIVTLVVGHLSIFSVMFLSIVVGLGTDYGVYLLLRNAEEIALGRPAREALEVTAMRAGPGMLGGALAAAGAVYVLMATDFPGIQELGFISGTSVLVAWFAMMTLLPALVLVVQSRRNDPDALPRDRGPAGVRFVDAMTNRP